MNLIDAFIFGIVEGVTEFLPVSSTGHLILTSRLLGLAQTNFLKSFEIAIQLGAILAVVVLYGRKFLIKGEVLKKVMAAFLPTAIIGFILYKLVKKMLLGNDQVVLWSLFLGGIFIIVFDLLHREDKNATSEITKISYGQAMLIGLFQSIAIIPGVSRSAATIIGGLILGINRKTIVEFSFLLAVPTMAAATALDLVKNIHAFSSDQFSFLAVGFITSFVVAIASIKFLLFFIQRFNFIFFGVYRIVLVLLFWFVVK